MCGYAIISNKLQGCFCLDCYQNPAAIVYCPVCVFISMAYIVLAIYVLPIEIFPQKGTTSFLSYHFK